MYTQATNVHLIGIIDPIEKEKFILFWFFC